MVSEIPFEEARDQETDKDNEGPEADKTLKPFGFGLSADVKLCHQDLVKREFSPPRVTSKGWSHPHPGQPCGRSQRKSDGGGRDTDHHGRDLHHQKEKDCIVDIMQSFPTEHGDSGFHEQGESNIKLQFVQLMVHPCLISQELLMFAGLHDFPPVKHDDTVRVADRR